MLTVPWKFFAEIDPEREYIAVATFLPIESGGSAFRADSKLVQEQLPKMKGCVGFSLRAKFLRGDYWTPSVWEEEADLMAYTVTTPHRDMMSPRAWRIKDFKTVIWRIPGSSIPPPWQEAFEHLASG